MHVEYHPAIEQELCEIIDYYNVCSEGLGHAFIHKSKKHNEINGVAILQRH
jgi:hypothetical protein